MNKDNIIGLVLIFGLLIAYSIWVTPSQEEIERKRFVQDSIAQTRQLHSESLQAARATETAAQQIIPEVLSVEDEQAVRNQLTDRFGSFAQAATGEEVIYYLENEVLRLGISTKGGRIVSAELKDFQSWDTLPLSLITAEASAFDIAFFANNRIIRTETLYFDPHTFGREPGDENLLKLQGNNELRFSMRAHTSTDGINKNRDSYIEFNYTLQPGEYMIGLDLNFVNTNRIIDDNTNVIELTWKNELKRQEKNLKNERNTSTVHYRYVSEDMGELSETKDAQESLRTRIRWIGFKQTFFNHTLVADDFIQSADIQTFTDIDNTGDRYLKSMQADIILPFTNTANYSIPLRMYLGPNKYNILRQYDLRLERQIPLGWGFFLLSWLNRYVVIPVFNYLESFNLNYGIIILILTILLKIVLFPLTYKTYISQARMRVLKPEVEELGKKFPKKEDAMKKQQAMMALYKKAGVNPMSGCVPMVIQLPILIALFRFFPSSIELRQQAFLWAHDLATYDSVLDLPFEIPFYGAHVSLFTLLMSLSTVAYTYVNSKMMDTGAQQMPGMKMMMYMMPIMFLGFFNNYSSGLSYYYMLTNLITFGQMFLIRKVINEDKIRAKIMENKKKPVKVSGWQKRLEDMAKQRGGQKTGKK
jgi:YidC/Oxa1 family membrane protein insertase